MRIVEISLILSTLLVFALLSVGCSLEGIFDCDSTLVAKAKSPGRRLVAEAMLVQCRATTSAAVRLLLGKTGAKLDEYRDRVAVFEGESISLRWEGSQLIVGYKVAKAFRADEEAKGVRIEYLSDHQDLVGCAACRSVVVLLPGRR